MSAERVDRPGGPGEDPGDSDNTSGDTSESIEDAVGGRAGGRTGSGGRLDSGGRAGSGKTVRPGRSRIGPQIRDEAVTEVRGRARRVSRREADVAAARPATDEDGEAGSGSGIDIGAQAGVELGSGAEPESARRPGLDTKPAPGVKSVPGTKSKSGPVDAEAQASRQVRGGADRAAAERSRRGPNPLLSVPEEPPPAVLDADIARPGLVSPSSTASMVMSIAGQIGQAVLTAITEPPVEAEPASVLNQKQDDDGPDRLLDLLEFLRSRLAGDYELDEFGFDPQFADAVPLNLLRPLYKNWFRVEVRGAENIPAEGGALIVANHSGAVPLDALMTAVAVREERERYLRILGGDLVFQTPVLAGLARRSGATLAANPDAERLLSSGELVGVWPEGYKGIGKPFSERYKLQRFGRGGFVSAALRTGVPIVPCSIVGAEEIYPIIANVPSLARLLGLPYLPVTPFFPLLGPLGAVPLPSKWLIEFGKPVETADLGPDGVAAAEDPILVFDLTDRIRQTIQQTLYSLLVQRRSVFF